MSALGEVRVARTAEEIVAERGEKAVLGYWNICGLGQVCRYGKLPLPPLASPPTRVHLVHVGVHPRNACPHVQRLK